MFFRCMSSRHPIDLFPIFDNKHHNLADHWPMQGLHSEEMALFDNMYAVFV